MLNYEKKQMKYKETNKCKIIKSLKHFKESQLSSKRYEMRSLSTSLWRT